MYVKTGCKSCGSFAKFAAILHVEDLDFNRIDFEDGRDRVTFSHNSLCTEGTDPGFDGATTDKGHFKHCAAIWWLTVVEFTPGRLAAAL